MKSPDEWVITKQACRNESRISLFFAYLNVYRALPLCIEHCTKEKSKHRLPIYIYIYLYIFLFFVCLFFVLFSCQKVLFLMRKKGIYISNRYFQIWSIFENGFIYIINIYTFFPWFKKKILKIRIFCNRAHWNASKKTIKKISKFAKTVYLQLSASRW